VASAGVSVSEQFLNGTSAQWHQLEHMQVILHLKPEKNNHANTTSLKFFTAGCSFCHPINSIKVLKAVTVQIK